MYITCALSITVKVNVGMIILLRSNSPLFFRCKHDVSPFHLADTYFNYLMMEGDSELSPKSDLQIARSGPPAAIFGFWPTVHLFLNKTLNPCHARTSPLAVTG